MRNVILLSLAALLMTAVNARAEVYECSSEAQGKYLLALTNDSGLVFRHKNEYFQEEKGEVTVARAMDGGPTFVKLDGKERNDWQSGGCFAMRVITHISIQHSRLGDTSTIQYLPTFDLNPDQTGCDHRSLPRPLVMPPQPIKCNLR